MIRQFLFAALICFFCPGLARAQVSSGPAAPSNLRVVPFGVNAFQLKWKDNSNNEKGWEIRVGLGPKSKPARYQLVAIPDLSSFVVILDEFPRQTLNFQVAAYNGVTGAEVLSNPTSVVGAVAFATSTFNPPTGMTASAIDDGRIRVSWNDMATSEHGYQVEVKRGAGAWENFGNTEAGITFSLPIAGFDPATRYSFRVRAFKGNPAVFTAYSNSASATTRLFLAPDTLVAKPDGEGAISFKWQDRSSIETGYEIQWRSGEGDFQSLGTVGANVSSTSPIKGFALRTDYEFRVRAIRVVGSAQVNSAFSNVSAVKTSALIMPAALAGNVTGDTSVRLTWDDASGLESGYQIQYREAGKPSFDAHGVTGANAETYTATGLSPGKSYDFRVVAFQESGFSATSYSQPTAPILLTTRNGFTSDLHPAVFWKTSFQYTVRVSQPELLASLTVTGLPTGLSYDPVLRTISGTTMAEGVKKAAMTAIYDGGYTVTRYLVLRIIRPPAPPIANGSFTPVTVAAGATSSVSTVNKFSDPDARDARRVATTVGNFDIILYPLATPATVANFLQYADGGRYNKSFIHRSLSDFIIQGGGYRYTESSGFRKVPVYAAVKNEAGISNVSGTVAMAKLPGNPDSATSEFFVNVNDSNAANLDNQNEGFTVFGRVATGGMTVVNRINDLPSKDYTVPVDGKNLSLEGVPVNAATAPDILDPDRIVQVVSVSPIPVLSYQVTSSDVDVATAVVSGTNVVITGVASGTSTLELKVTDLDGSVVSRNIQVTVP